MKSPDSQEVAG